MDKSLFTGQERSGLRLAFKDASACTLANERIARRYRLDPVIERVRLAMKDR